MQSLRQTAAILAVVALAAWMTPALLAQRHPGGGGRPAPPPRPAPGVRPARPGGPKGRPGNPAMAVDRWNAMTPEERQKALDKLPPQRQKEILARIERFNNLPKEEQDRLRRRAERLAELSPERRQKVLKQIARFSQLSTDRRQALSHELESLRPLSESERNTRMSSEEFRGHYSADEQAMIRDLAQLL